MIYFQYFLSYSPFLKELGQVTHVFRGTHNSRYQTASTKSTVADTKFFEKFSSTLASTRILFYGLFPFLQVNRGLMDFQILRAMYGKLREYSVKNGNDKTLCMPSGKRHPMFPGRHTHHFIISDLYRSLPTSHGDCRSPLDPCYVRIYQLTINKPEEKHALPSNCCKLALI